MSQAQKQDITYYLTMDELVSISMTIAGKIIHPRYGMSDRQLREVNTRNASIMIEEFNRRLKT